MSLTDESLKDEPLSMNLTDESYDEFAARLSGSEREIQRDSSSLSTAWQATRLTMARCKHTARTLESRGALHGQCDWRRYDIPFAMPF